MIKLRKESIPWAMAAGRALLGPILILGERCGWSGLTLASLVVTALLSDIFDGVLARRWKCDTAAVRLFDSFADTVFYSCAAIALWVCQPNIWRDNAVLLGAVLLAEAVNQGFSLAKFGKPASYHSYLAKSWGLVLATAAIAVLATRHSNPLIPIALILGVASNLEGLAMSLILPTWHKDVRTLRAAWTLRTGLRRNCNPIRFAKKLTFAAAGAALLALGLLTAQPALAIEPGQAAYAGGTAQIALDTPGTLNTASPATLSFEYKASGGILGRIAIDYSKIRSFEFRRDVVRHIGVLPAATVGLLAHRQRRYTVTISYADSSDAMQVVTFQTTERDQHTLEGILRARAPQASVGTPFSRFAVPRPKAF